MAERDDEADDGFAATAAPGAVDGTLPVSGEEVERAAARAGAIAAGVHGLETVGRDSYVVSGELARGGLGRILRARDRRLDRPVALKEMLHGGADLSARFVREAMVTARLQHPAIVPVYEAGRWPSGDPFYAMKLVSGRPLDAVVAGAKTLADRLALLPNVLAVFEALAYAHQEQIIHRDLKPQNVLVGSFGETVVIDWGLAKDLADAAASDVDAGPFRTPSNPGETAAGAVMGTPAFMPPEQARGEAVDPRADVYALGALLYHVLAGHPPYSGTSTQGIIDAVVAGPPVALEKRQPNVPPELATLVAKAMARDPADRYPTAAELAEELRRYQTGQLIGAHRYTAWMLLRRFVRRHRAAVTAAAVVLMIAVAGTIFYLRRERTLRRDAESARVDAEQARDTANDRLAAVLIEQGRGEMMRWSYDRALPYLAAAYRARPDDRGLRIMLAEAAARAEATEAELTLDEQSDYNFFVGDGDRIRTEGMRTGVTLWDVPSGRRLGRWSGSVQGSGGNRFLVASRAGASQLVDRNGKLVRTLVLPPDEEFSHAKVSADGGFVVLQTQRGPDHSDVTRLWRPDRSAETTELTLPPDTHFELGAVGRIAVFDMPGSVEAWDLDKRQRLAAVSNRGRKALSPDEHRLAVMRPDGALSLIEVASGAILWSRQQATDPTELCMLQFHAAGRQLVVLGRNGLQLIDAADGRVLGELPGVGCDEIISYTHGVAQRSGWNLEQLSLARTLEPEGMPQTGNLYLGSLPVGVGVWDLAAGQLVGSFPPFGERRSVRSPDSEKLLISEPMRIRVLRRTNGRLRGAIPSRRMRNLPVMGEQVHAAVDRSLHRIVSEDRGEVYLWESGRLLPRAGLARSRLPAEFAPDGTTVVTQIDGGLALFDATDGAQRWELDLGGEPLALRDIRWSPGGDRIAAVGKSFVALVSVSGQLIARRDDVAQLGDLRAVQFIAGGRKLVAMSTKGMVVLDGRTGTTITTHPRQEIGAHRAVPYLEDKMVAIDPRTGVVAVGRAAGSIDIWDQDLGQVTRNLPAHAGEVQSIHFAGGAPIMASMAEDEKVILWKTDDWSRIREVAAGTTPRAVRLSPDGMLMATYDDDGVQVWDTAAGKPLIRLYPVFDDPFPRYGGRSHEILEFAPDGTALMFQASGYLITWDLTPESRAVDEIDRLAERVPWVLDGGSLRARAPLPLRSGDLVVDEEGEHADPHDREQDRP